MSKEGDSCFPWKECSVTVQFKNRYVTLNTQFKTMQFLFLTYLTIYRDSRDIYKYTPIYIYIIA